MRKVPPGSRRLCRGVPSGTSTNRRTRNTRPQLLPRSSRKYDLLLFFALSPYRRRNVPSLRRLRESSGFRSRLPCRPPVWTSSWTYARDPALICLSCHLTSTFPTPPPTAQCTERYASRARRKHREPRQISPGKTEAHLQRQVRVSRGDVQRSP